MEFIEIMPGESFDIFNKVRTDLYPSKSTDDPPAKDHLIACYILMDGGIAKGRFALYQNSAIVYQNKKTACIGNYECVSGEKYAHLLIDKAITEAKNTDAQFLIGPMNGSTWENYRFADRINNDRFPLEPYNHPYYTEQFKIQGFDKISNYYTAIDTDLKYQKSGIEKIEKGFIEKGFRFRNIDLDDYENELYKIHELSNIAFENGFLFTKFGLKSFMNKYLPLKNIIDPEFVILAEDTDGLLCGFIFCIKDLEQPKLNRLIIKTIARKPGKAYAGIGEIAGKIIYERALNKGYHAIIHALMFDHGFSVPHSKHRTGNRLNTYSLYAKEIAK